MVTSDSLKTDSFSSTEINFDKLDEFVNDE